MCIVRAFYNEDRVDKFSDINNEHLYTKKIVRMNYSMSQLYAQRICPTVYNEMGGGWSGSQTYALQDS